MIARLVSLYRRLTALERFTAAWAAMLPIALGLAVIVDVAFSPRSAAPAAIVLGYYLATIGLAGLAVLLRLVRRRRTVVEDVPAEPGKRSFTPSENLAQGVLADEPGEWAQLSSPQVEAERTVRAFGYFSRRALAFFAMRSRSRWAREPISYLATGGFLDYATLERLVVAAADGDEDADLLLAEIDLGLLLTLSRVVSSQMLDPGDAVFATAIYRYAAGKVPRRSLSVLDQLYLAGRLILIRDLDGARGVLGRLNGNRMVERMLRADVVNPHGRTASPADLQLWFDAFNRVYVPHGLEPVSLDGAGKTPYDRLSSVATSTTDGGPMISVIMTCFRPDHSLITAVDSVIAQSWQNWELLIADDASGEEFRPFIDQVASRDPRIRVLLAEENAGTYVRRNDAVNASRGDFITMHDSDDWTHPRRLELQARHLQAHDDLPANLGSSVRVSEQLTFVQPRGVVIRHAESSLMFRKQLVIDRIGYFDDVRKAGDSEYRLRMEAAFDVTVPTVESVSPLCLIRYASTSLSASQVADGWIHPARSAYRSAFSLWHSDIRSGAVDPRLDFPHTERPFVAPHQLTGLAPRTDRLDVLVLADFREETNSREHLRRVITELSDLVSAGLAVGVIQIETPTEGKAQLNLAPDVQRLISSGTIQLVLLEDARVAEVVIVRHASAAQVAPSTQSNVSAGRVVVIDDSGSGRDEAGRTFAEREVRQALLAMFGTQPEWKTARAKTVSALVAELAGPVA